jgi:trk system potassium uptake protein TrkA
MDIIIVGAGTIGRSIAGLLVQENHNVTLVDSSLKRLEEIAATLDLHTLQGWGSDYEVLELAGAEQADLLLAVTDHDEVNLLSAHAAKRLGTNKTVARVSRHCYLNSVRLNYRALLDIDLVLSPEVLTAVEIVKFLDNPDALALEHFAHGRVQLRKVVIAADSPLVRTPLKELTLPEGVLVVSIVRGEEIVIPKGDDVFAAGDKVIFMGLAEMTHVTQQAFHESKEEIQSIVIAGGGETGLFLAQTLEKRRYRVKLIESDRERCNYLSRLLDRVTIINGDATDAQFLKEERISGADVYIAVTGDEEVNIMSSLLAKELGARQCITKVERPDYISIMERSGIDLALSPRLVTANKVISLLKRGKIKSLSILEEGKAEVIEFQAAEGAAVVNRPLAEVEFPTGCLVGAIVHLGKVKVPRGRNIIYPGDLVIVFCLAKVAEEVEKLFQAK